MLLLVGLSVIPRLIRGNSEHPLNLALELYYPTLAGYVFAQDSFSLSTSHWLSLQVLENKLAKVATAGISQTCTGVQKPTLHLIKINLSRAQT